MPRSNKWVEGIRNVHKIPLQHLMPLKGWREHGEVLRSDIAKSQFVVVSSLVVYIFLCFHTLKVNSIEKGQTIRKIPRGDPGECFQA